MNDKHFRNFAFAVGAAGLLYWLFRRKQNQAVNTTPDVSTESPEQIVYAANPSAFLPPSVSNINVNIANQGLGYLSNQYIPLFGFVGMANGVTFQ